MSAALRVLPGPLFGSAGPEGVLEFQAIVFGQSVELSSIFRPSAHVSRRRAAFTTCSNPRQRASRLTVRIHAYDQDAAPRYSANASLKARSGPTHEDGVLVALCLRTFARSEVTAVHDIVKGKALGLRIKGQRGTKELDLYLVSANSPVVHPGDGDTADAAHHAF